MCNNFTHAVNDLLQYEGGYSDDLQDPGGQTNFGITQTELCKCHIKLQLPGEVIKLTKDNAITYYKHQWWIPQHYNYITAKATASKIFNMAVNMGQYQATRIAQRSYNLIAAKELLDTDGILGHQTISAINAIHESGLELPFINEICSRQANYYETLVYQHPLLKKFLQGWLNRARYKG